MTAVLGALASVAFAALIVVAGYSATVVLLAGAVALLVVVLALGWGSILDLPARRGTGLVIALVGLAGAALAVRATVMTRPLAPFAALLAAAVLAAFVRELTRRQGRPRLVESVAGTLSGEALAVLGGGWVLLPGTRLSLAALVVAAAAVAGARVAALLPVPGRLAGWVCLGAGTAVGAGTGAALDRAGAVPLLALAIVVSAAVAALDRLLSGLAGRHSVPAVLSAGAAPVLAVGTVAYAMARLVA
ncbi:MAG TPA: hypothetical protein VI248_20175 [Kineosporiaceae bacterium]